jgi:hypothetical protein
MKMLKRFLKVFGVIVAIIGVVRLWLMWGLGEFGNWGLESGHYGQFNRVKHVLEDMPHVRITNDWRHHDIALEDFGFDLVVDGDRSIRVDFLENSPQMKMRDKARIREYIEEQITEDSNKPNGR